MLHLNYKNAINEFLQNHYRSLYLIDTLKIVSPTFLLVVYMSDKIV